MLWQYLSDFLVPDDNSILYLHVHVNRCFTGHLQSFPSLRDTWVNCTDDIAHQLDILCVLDLLL